MGTPNEKYPLDDTLMLECVLHFIEKIICRAVDVVVQWMMIWNLCVYIQTPANKESARITKAGGPRLFPLKFLLCQWKSTAVALTTFHFHKSIRIRCTLGSLNHARNFHLLVTGIKSWCCIHIYECNVTIRRKIKREREKVFCSFKQACMNKYAPKLWLSWTMQLYVIICKRLRTWSINNIRPLPYKYVQHCIGYL